mgnify:CR=1 FL=1
MFRLPRLDGLNRKFPLITKFVHGIKSLVGEVLGNKVAYLQHVMFIFYIGYTFKYLHLVFCEYRCCSDIVRNIRFVGRL